MFTDRLVVNVRPDQRTSLQNIATALELTVSDLTRWILDNGIRALTDAWKETMSEPVK